MARKLPGLQRVLEAPSLAAVAYGEIASSLFFALGIVALFALGLTPWVLLAVGALFVVIAMSYAEGTAAIPETGGAAMFVRRAFNDPLGFLVGWVLFLDYLIVIALAGLFVPEYFGHAVGWDAPTRRPWDLVLGMVVIVAVGLVRLVRRPGLYRLAIVIAGASLSVLLLLVLLGFPLLFSVSNLMEGTDIGTAPSWSSLAFALPIAMLAFTGLETVANLAAETREPGKTLPRSLFIGVGAAVVISVLVALVALSAYPAHEDPSGPSGHATDLGTEWVRAPIVGLAAAFEGHLPSALVDLIRIAVGLTAAAIRVATITTSFSGAGRLAYSLGRHDMLPRNFARLNRRTFIAPLSIVGAAALSCGLLAIAAAEGTPVRFLASLYSFGVLIAFTAAQIAVVRLRFREPELERPFRVPWNVRWRGTDVPVPALVGIPLTVAIFGASLATHNAARVAGPLWLLAGAVIFVWTRLTAGERVLGAVTPAIGEAIVDAAREADADLVLMGSAPKWRRQSRFFSPTVDYVLRQAPCAVMVVTYPQGVFDEDGMGVAR